MFRSFRFAVFALGALALWAAFSAGPALAEPLGVNNVVPAAPTAAPTTQATNADVEAAITAFREGRFDDCLRLLKKAADKDSKMPPPQVTLADLFRQAKQPTAMRQALDQAVTNYPADPQAYIVLGDLALSENRICDASLEFAKAQELLKTFTASAERKKALEPGTIIGLARIAKARQKWPEAQKQFEAYLLLNPKDTGALQELANALFQQAEAGPALKMLRKAYELDPKTVLTPEATLALFYERYPDHRNAVTWMNIALTKYPEDLKTLINAGGWALETGQLEEAKKHAAKAMQLDPKSVDARMLRGVVALFLKDYKAAEDDFQVILEQYPKNFGAKNNLALALCEEKDDIKKSRALDYATDNAQLNPKSADALTTLGWVFYRLGRLNDAEECLKRTAAAANGHLKPDGVYYYAQIAYDPRPQGRGEEAPHRRDEGRSADVLDAARGPRPARKAEQRAGKETVIAAPRPCTGSPLTKTALFRLKRAVFSFPSGCKRAAPMGLIATGTMRP